MPELDTELQLQIRTPGGLLYSGQVEAISAEDLDGWFGIRRGRPDLMAVLPPGLLSFRDADGEGFVANDGGVLDLHRGCCRVALRSALLARNVDELAPLLQRSRQQLQLRARAREQVVDRLLDEAMRRATRSPGLDW